MHSSSEHVTNIDNIHTYMYMYMHTVCMLSMLVACPLEDCMYGVMYMYTSGVYEHVHVYT